MRDEIIISKDEYVQLVNALEKVIYVLHRSESRDNPDTRAYSLALGYEEMKIWDDLMAARDILYNAIQKRSLMNWMIAEVLILIEFLSLMKQILKF